MIQIILMMINPLITRTCRPKMMVIVHEQFVDSNLGSMLELNVIMDNCAGQNKNHMVIQMAMYMLELYNM